MSLFTCQGTGQYDAVLLFICKGAGQYEAVWLLVAGCEVSGRQGEAAQ
jgi:hypothetical protein